MLLLIFISFRKSSALCAESSDFAKAEQPSAVTEIDSSACGNTPRKISGKGVAELEAKKRALRPVSNFSLKFLSIALAVYSSPFSSPTNPAGLLPRLSQPQNRDTCGHRT
jgi:hypothetical protein